MHRYLLTQVPCGFIDKTKIHKQLLPVCGNEVGQEDNQVFQNLVGTYMYMYNPPNYHRLDSFALGPRARVPNSLNCLGGLQGHGNIQHNLVLCKTR